MNSFTPVAAGGGAIVSETTRVRHIGTITDPDDGVPPLQIVEAAGASLMLVDLACTPCRRIGPQTTRREALDLTREGVHSAHDRLEPGGLVLEVWSHRRRQEEGAHEAREANMVLGQFFNFGVQVSDAVRLRDLFACHLEVVQGVTVGLAGGGEALVHIPVRPRLPHEGCGPRLAAGHPTPPSDA